MRQKTSKSGTIFFGGSDRDRARLQELFTRFESRVRRHLRGKLRAIEQRWYDADDVFASARRRLDRRALERGITAGSEDEIMGLFLKAVLGVVIDRRRCERREQRLVTELVGRKSGSPSRDVSSRKFASDLETILAHFESNERFALELCAKGYKHALVAEILGMSFEDYRRWWRRVCAMRDTQPG